MQRVKNFKSAIALLITVFFIMIITLSLGIGFKYINNATKSMNREAVLVQSVAILDDFFNILKKSPELNEVNDAESLALFLELSSILPFDSNGINVLISIESARAKVNPNTFTDTKRLDAFKAFLIDNNVITEYADILEDMVSGVKEDGLYNTDVFIENPYLFREYIASSAHLKKINTLYKNRYHESNIDKIAFDKLFYFSKDKNSSVDLNHATPLAWELMSGCDEMRAKELSANGQGAYASVKDILLNDDENLSLSQFNVSLYEPIIYITIDITQKNENIIIKFEYNIEKKKGSNFVFEV